MSEFTMPSLGADMEAGTLVEWMRKPGDRVQRGDAIAAVETQKGAIEIEVFESGVLERILVEIGQRVPVGTVLAIIRSEREVAGATVPGSGPPAATTTAVPVLSAPRAIEPAPKAAAAAEAVVSSARITPAALRRAQELGIEMKDVRPGSDGVIGLREVEAARPAEAAAVAARAPVSPGVDLDEMRKAIAAAMARSWREIPHYFVGSILDVTPLLSWLQRENLQRPIAERLHYAAPLAKAVALALKKTPVLNGHYGERGFQPSDHVHLGIAIALRGGGLIAPTILDADTLPVPELMKRLDDLVARVRGGRLRSSEMTAATATLSNLGEETADVLQPVIYPPQVAIVGCGQIVERAWAHDDALSARQTMTVTVGGDHRVSDGRAASKFLTRLANLLQHPEAL
jgi:pyruvate dehydrogenase E2 component (dihydrolipoamide acetyltransferase)